MIKIRQTELLNAMDPDDVADAVMTFAPDWIRCTHNYDDRGNVLIFEDIQEADVHYRSTKV